MPGEGSGLRCRGRATRCRAAARQRRVRARSSPAPCLRQVRVRRPHLARAEWSCFTSAMKLFGVAVMMVGLVSCGGRAQTDSVPSNSDDSSDATTLTSQGGSAATGDGGTLNGAGAGGDTSGTSGSSAANAGVLVACAPSVGGAQPRPVCITDYAVGLPCDPTTFQICSSLDYTAVIWCGRPGICDTPAPPPSDAGAPNPCVGSCLTLNQRCADPRGTGLPDYTCCDNGGPWAWVHASYCPLPPK